MGEKHLFFAGRDTGPRSKRQATPPRSAVRLAHARRAPPRVRGGHGRRPWPCAHGSGPDRRGRAGQTGDAADQFQPRHPADPRRTTASRATAPTRSSARRSSTSTPRKARLPKPAIIVRGQRRRAACWSSASPTRTLPSGCRRPSPGHALTDQQIALLRRWIEEGAKWDTHWAYTAAEASGSAGRRRAPAGSRTPIDRFILARLEREGLKPSPEADKDDAAAPRRPTT